MMDEMNILVQEIIYLLRAAVEGSHPSNYLEIVLVDEIMLLKSKQNWGCWADRKVFSLCIVEQVPMGAEKHWGARLTLIYIRQLLEPKNIWYLRLKFPYLAIFPTGKILL